MKIGKWECKFDLMKVITPIAAWLTGSLMLFHGCTPEQIETTISVITTVLGGISITKEEDKDKNIKELSETIERELKKSKAELPDSCMDILKSSLFDYDAFLDILTADDRFYALKIRLEEICRKSKECDLNTLPLNQIVIFILSKCDEEIKKDHELEELLLVHKQYTELHPNIKTANEQYANSFVEPLFLHKSDYYSPVNLTNLFVEPKYKILHWKNFDLGTENSKDGFKGLLKTFFKDDENRFLFIEGDAGCGKTTLAAWMNYHYMLKDEFAETVFGDRPLLTVRLRNLDKDILKKDGFSVAVRSYLGLGSLEELNGKFPNAILLLDGFDELCMIEEMSLNYNNQLQPFSEDELENFKIIITSRPKIISSDIELSSVFISLLHFDREQREKWIENYTSSERCNQSIDEKIRNYILNINDNKVSCICDTPMTLYMLAAKKGAANYLENDWLLYHHIFYSTLSGTKHNAMFPSPDYKYVHEIDSYKEVLYRISEEIAYEMYKKDNSDFYLKDEQLSTIIEKLGKEQQYRRLHLQESTTQEIVRHCYALCNYWKASEDRGVVEFLHNNIRDFFLAEKIYRELDAAAEAAKASGNEDQCRIISQKLCDLFAYGSLETNVMYFIYSRAEHNKNKGIEDFAEFEYESRMIADIIVDMSHGNVLQNSLFNTNSEFNPVQRIINIVKCTVQIYRMAYEPYLKNNECIRWFPEKTRKNILLDTLFGRIFADDRTLALKNSNIGIGSRSDFSGDDLIVDLALLNFYRVNFSESIFDSTFLSRTNFDSANLYGTQFKNAYLYKADFSSANLKSANFQNAYLVYADLTNTDLREADFRGAFLCGAILPDGFRSDNRDFEDNQVEQIEHLKSLNIPGLKI